MNATAHFLRALFGSAIPGALIELRAKLPNVNGMAREFVPADGLEQAAERALELASSGDCYVGVLPRRPTPGKQSGGRDATPFGSVLWADCDTIESVRALVDHKPLPAIVVKSGSGGRHAYWPLREQVPARELERANRLLAGKVGADVKATDPPRILRPPGTVNRKHNPPARVELTRFAPSRFTLAEVVGKLPTPKPKVKPKPKFDGGLPVAEVATDAYFAALCGVEPDREGMVSCPLPDHEDRTPSCRLYDDGWYCFGCERGGTVYDLASQLWQLGTKGPDFLELDRRLRSELGVAA